MATYLPGKLGKVVAGGVNIGITQWSANLQCERIDVTNTSSAGYAEGIAGIYTGQISFSGPVDTDSMPNGTPNLIEGESVVVACHLHNTGKTIAGTLLLESVNWTSQVRGAPVMVAISGSFTGSYTRPAT